MDEEYDIIILGTGIKETILSALLQKKQLKVLNIDRNRWYGGEAASLQLDQLYEKFKGTKPPAMLGDQRYWAVDLCPKFLLASGRLTQLLRVTRVTQYMAMCLIPGSYIANSKTIYKVPATAGEATTSTLLGLFERFRFKSMLEFINDFDAAKDYPEKKLTTQQFFKKYDLSDDAIEFCGHALALHTDDTYLSRNCVETIEKIKLYADSLARWGSSPFIYPEWGLGTMSEAFSRLCSINGGLQMLGEKVGGFEYTDGKVSGVILNQDKGPVTIKAKRILADPTFAHECKPERVKQTGSIIHSIVFMKNAVPETKNANAVQLVIPASQLGRKNDIYVAAINHVYSVCAQGWYVATISTIQEKPDLAPEKEIAHAYKLLGNTFADTFTWVTPYYIPTEPDATDNLFVSESQDPTTHFELATSQVLEMYKQITGEEFDFNQPVPETEDM